MLEHNLTSLSSETEFNIYPGIVSCKSIRGIRTAEEARIKRDSLCVLVANLHLRATDCQLRQHFEACGSIRDIELNFCCDIQMGYAYIEFTDPTSVVSALALNGSTFKGFEIWVERKITEKMADVRSRGF